MKVLLVDNKSAHLERLKALIAEYIDGGRIKQVVPEEIDDKAMQWADVVIVSGGQGRSVLRNRHVFDVMVERIEKFNKPTIGICLGAEAIAVYFGADLKQLPVRRVGNVRILPVSNRLAIPEEGMLVYEFHRWMIERDLPDDLEEIAYSKDGVEVFRHKKYPIWGMQFHPEVKIRDNQGYTVFEKLLNELGLVTHAS